MKRKFATLNGAVRRVRELEKIIDSYKAIAERFDAERKSLAKLAAKGPAFFNPLHAFAAEAVRDRILHEMGMNPDGTFISKTVEQE